MTSAMPQNKGWALAPARHLPVVPRQAMSSSASCLPAKQMSFLEPALALHYGEITLISAKRDFLRLFGSCFSRQGR